MYRLDKQLFDDITRLRVEGGGEVLRYAQHRKRRDKLTRDGRLVILAADHPARMVTGVGDDPVAMGDRADYLGRIVTVLASGKVDGLMGTPDILEEVMAVDFLQNGRTPDDSFLADKVLVGCMNRGGLAGTAFEMDDAFTAYTAEQMRGMNLDGAKMMFRLDPLDYGSGRTIEACSRAINDCLDRDLTVFLEPMMVRYEEGKYIVDTSAEAMIRICGVASGLGKSSWKTWLKLPYSVDYPRIVGATTCPILMLGGPATGNPQALIDQFAEGMKAGSNVRGALVGRNVLYPGEADPAEVARAVSEVVHSS